MLTHGPSAEGMKDKVKKGPLTWSPSQGAGGPKTSSDGITMLHELTALDQKYLNMLMCEFFSFICGSSEFKFSSDLSHLWHHFNKSRTVAGLCRTSLFPLSSEKK